MGLPESPVLGVVLRNVKLSGRRGLTIGYAEVAGLNVSVRSEDGKAITEGRRAKVNIR